MVVDYEPSITAPGRGCVSDDRVREELPSHRRTGKAGRRRGWDSNPREAGKPLRHFECRALGQTMRPLRRAGLYPASSRIREEAGQQGGAFGLPHAGHQVDAVVQPAVLGNVVQAPRRSRLGIGGAVDDPLQPRQHRRPRAHGARLQGHHQGAAFQPPVAPPPGGLREHQHLGMGRRVVALLPAVVVGRGRPAPGVDQHRPHGYIAVAGGQRRLGQSRLHPVIPGHGRHQTTSGAGGAAVHPPLNGYPAAPTGRLLGPGAPTAPGAFRLGLLPSGPDPIHEGPAA